MASPSSNSLWKYDVFLSFYGKDTRRSFVCHLYRELDQLGVNTFKDDEKLERGTYVNEELMRAIKESKFAIVVISKRYAFSRWCLQELLEIMECRKKGSLIVMPIFYDVHPSNVRRLAGSFSRAFKKHENLPDVGRWKEALSGVATIAGDDSNNRNYKDDAKLIQRISKDILNRLNSMVPSHVHKLKGMDAHMKAIEPLLEARSKDEVRVIGLCGMGGIGKTTIAQHIYKSFSGQFQASCFIYNVRSIYKSHDEVYLQEHFLSKILKKDMKLSDNIEGRDVIRARLGHQKVLIVLDDVDEKDQINCLAGKTNWFGAGSRIIITSREKGLLSEFSEYEINAHEVRCLNKQDAIKLFSQHAFGQEIPKDTYLELSIRAINYARGIPLVLKVLGSHLSGKGKDEWKMTQSYFEKNFHEKIMNVLKVSYEGLSEEAKGIFLYLACFFKNEHTDRVIRLLSNRYSYVEHWINVLVEKSLVEVWDGYVTMHDFLQEMGMEIHRLQSIDQPGKRKFLTDSIEGYDILKDEMGTEAVEVISLIMSKKDKLTITNGAFEKMPNLRFLHVYGSCHQNTTTDADGFTYLPRKLLSLMWNGFPWCTLPSGFRPDCLVELIMRHSKLERVWEGTQPLVHLRKIDLEYSSNLTTIPNLSMAANLEELNVAYCSSLVEVPCIEGFKKLVHLDMSFCTQLQWFPSCHNMKDLKYLDLTHCCNLKIFPEVSPSIEFLGLSFTAVEDVPPSIGNLLCLVHLDMSGTNISSIPGDVGNLSNLKTLNLSFCEMLMDIPGEIIEMKSLENLRLEGCILLKSLPVFPTSLRCVWAHGCSSLEEIASLWMLSCLVLSDCRNVNTNQVLQQIAFIHYQEMANPFFICLPECEVARWCFSSQSKGSSLTTPLVQHRLLVKFIGYIVVPTAGDYEKLYLSVRCECLLRGKGGTEKWLNLSWPDTLYVDCIHDDAKRDRLFLFSYHLEKPEEYTEMVLEFSFDGMSRYPAPQRIKQCGVHPIYIEDLKKYDSDELTAGSSSSYHLTKQGGRHDISRSRPRGL